MSNIGDKRPGGDMPPPPPPKKKQSRAAQKMQKAVKDSKALDEALKIR
jgi:hypothetical protein